MPIQAGRSLESYSLNEFKNLAEHSNDNQNLRIRKSNQELTNTPLGFIARYFRGTYAAREFVHGALARQDTRLPAGASGRDQVGNRTRKRTDAGDCAEQRANRPGCFLPGNESAVAFASQECAVLPRFVRTRGASIGKPARTGDPCSQERTALRQPKR